MTTPLVLINGAICEEPAGMSGVYPLLRIINGVRYAGGAGNNLCLIDGAIYEYLSGGLYVLVGYVDDGYVD